MKGHSRSIAIVRSRLAFMLAGCSAATVCRADVSATQKAAYFYAVRSESDNAERLIALRAVRDARLPAAEVEPLLVEVLQNTAAKDATQRDEKELARRVSMEALALMDGRASDNTFLLLAGIAIDPRESRAISAQALITISKLKPDGSIADSIGAILSSALGRPQLPAPLYDEVTITLSDIPFEARDALGELVVIVEGGSPDPTRHDAAAKAFAVIAASLQDRGDVLSKFDLIRFDRLLGRGIVALKRSGNSRSLAQAHLVEASLAGLRSEEARHLGVSSVRWIVISGPYYGGLTLLVYSCWAFILASAAVVAPRRVQALDAHLHRMDFSKLPKIDAVAKGLGVSSERLASLVAWLSLVSVASRWVAAHRARTRRRAAKGPSRKSPAASEKSTVASTGPRKSGARPILECAPSTPTVVTESSDSKQHPTINHQPIT